MIPRINQRGGSIIEVMVMSGVMVAMMTGFMSLMSHESKNVTYLEDKLSRVALESELRMFFSDSSYCENLLVGLVAPKKNNTNEITRILNKTTQVAALDQVFRENGNQIFYDKLEVKKISMEQSDLTEPNSSGTMNLMFYPTRLRKGGGPPSLQPVKIRTNVTVNDKYEIQACHSNDDTKPGCSLGDLEKRFPGSVLVDWYKPQSTTAMMPGNTPGAYLKQSSKVYCTKSVMVTYGNTFLKVWENQKMNIPSSKQVTGAMICERDIGPEYSLNYNFPFTAICEAGKWDIQSEITSSGNISYKGVVYNVFDEVVGGFSPKPIGVRAYVVYSDRTRSTPEVWQTRKMNAKGEDLY